jgi:hypothetical protein
VNSGKPKNLSLCYAGRFAFLFAISSLEYVLIVTFMSKEDFLDAFLNRDPSPPVFGKVATIKFCFFVLNTSMCSSFYTYQCKKTLLENKR